MPVLSVGLPTSTTTFPLPPAQVAVIPLERVLLALFAGLTNVGNAGIKIPITTPRQNSRQHFQHLAAQPTKTPLLPRLH